MLPHLAALNHPPASRTANTMADPPYRDPNLAVDARVADLLGRMTIEEKAGQLFHTMLSPGPGGTLAGPEPTWGLEDTRTLLEEKHMTHFNLAGPVFDARQTAAWHNALQRHVLAHTRLGIPVTLSSDPRSHVGACANNVGTGAGAGAMSRWPGTLGLTALRDEGVARSFAGVVRREYAALGLRVALHPQADVATEPRWARNGTTFGEDAGLVAELTTACVAGLQGDGDGAGLGSGVSTVTKHFPGAGPELDGEDSHFVYGKEQVYPGGKFEYHLEPFRRAIAAGARQIMVSLFQVMVCARARTHGSSHLMPSRLAQNTSKWAVASTRALSRGCSARSSVSTASCSQTGA